MLSSNLTGCASFDLFGPKEKPIEVVSKPVEKTPLNIPQPDPLKLKPFTWVIITKDNATEVFAKLEQQGDSVVLFGLTGDGYQELSMTIAELRVFIATQKEIITKYKNYYEKKNVD